MNGPCLLLTRPRADSVRLAALLQAEGWRTLIDPLLEIRPLPVSLPDLAGVQAVLLTSRHAAPALAALPRPLPVHCVGEATARAACTLTTAPVFAGPGDAVGMARQLTATLRPVDGALLHLAGAEHRPELKAGLEAAGFTLIQRIVYRALPAAGLMAETRQALAQGAVQAVLLFSPRTASLFAALSQDLDLSRTEALCLSANVAAALPAGRLRRVRVATRPEEAALLDLLEAPAPE
ncbi:MAG TPA: uroporphyrinogen-III synthase [Geminicoccus sp.]|uniref:uroporphyrinogen-III synthase n=1 Tax=Geminicoccus sp. TaxID=2024832 RepID=UPI002CE85F4D|nr:uroporphyrinogen-III synthase [Geminicoccus sp.]HWL71968.1 uroporphyrinogen-III synthase [Geminicoccus sp.]